MLYVLIHFDSNYVSGYICPDMDPKEAVADIKKRLISAYKAEIAKNPNDEYHNASRIKSFIKVFKRPWRITKRGKDPVIQFQQIDFPLSAGYWLDEIITGKHTCNILPKIPVSWEQSAQSQED